MVKYQNKTKIAERLYKINKQYFFSFFENYQIIKKDRETEVLEDNLFEIDI